MTDHKWHSLKHRTLSWNDVKDIKHPKSTLLLHLLILSNWGPSLHGQDFMGLICRFGKDLFCPVPSPDPKNISYNMLTKTSLMYLIVPNDHSLHDQGSQEETSCSGTRVLFLQQEDNLSKDQYLFLGDFISYYFTIISSVFKYFYPNCFSAFAIMLAGWTPWHLLAKHWYN